MNDTVIAALVGGMAGVITGFITALLTPLVNWKLEERKWKREFRVNLIAKWRKMMSDVAKAGSDVDAVKSILNSHEDFYSLLPHLLLDEAHQTQARKTAQSLGTSTFVVMLTEEIQRIENRWGLSP